MKIIRTLFTICLLISDSYNNTQYVLFNKEKNNEKVSKEFSADDDLIGEQLSMQLASKFNASEDSFVAMAIRAEYGDSIAFDTLTYNIGLSLNEAISDALELSPAAKQELNMQLEEFYPEISKEARTMYIERIKDIEDSNNNNITSTEHSIRAKVLASVMNEMVCSFATLLFIPLKINTTLTTSIAASIALQNPCETLLEYPMTIIAKQLASSGNIKDLETTCVNIEMQKKSLLANVSASEMEFRIESSYKVDRSLGYGQWQKKWQAGKVFTQL